MNAPELKISVVSNVWIKQMTFKQAGDFMQGHTHKFDHQTLLAFGDFEIVLDGETYKASSGTILFIESGKVHSVRALTAGALAYCIHPIRDGEKVEDIVDPSDMPMYNGSINKGFI